jgi:hypothetical protein
MVMAEITMFDFDGEKIINKRKALLDVTRIESVQEISHTNLQMEKDRFNRIFENPIFAIIMATGSRFLVDKKEYIDIKKLEW